MKTQVIDHAEKLKQNINVVSDNSKKNIRSLIGNASKDFEAALELNKKLIEILNKLVDKGNTVVLIEHNLDIVKNADYIIDIGPEGGVGGGKIVATGTPESVAGNVKSYTGHYLKKALKRKK